MSFYYGDPSVYTGIPVQLNENAPRGKVYVFSDPTTIVLHPIDALYVEHPGETDWQWENIYRDKVVDPLLRKFDLLIWRLEMENIESSLLRLHWEFEGIEKRREEIEDLFRQSKGRIKRFRVGDDDAYSYHHVLEVDKLVHS